MMSQHCTYNYSQKGFSREKNLSRERAKNTVDNDYHYYGARYYNSNLSIWLSVDSKADAFPQATPYNAFLNNPIMMIDPGGDSTYALSANGRITGVDGKVYGSDDNPMDRIVAENGDHLDVTQGFLENFSGERQDGDVRQASSGSASEIYEAFKFLADNSSTEWGAFRDDNDNYHLVTKYNENASPSPESLGYNNIKAAVHSHPGVSGFQNELESFGLVNPVLINSKGAYRSRLVINPSDYYSQISGKLGTPRYLYFPNSKNVFHVSSNGVSYIRNIGSDYSRLFFGTLNAE